MPSDEQTFPLCAYLDELVDELRKLIPFAVDDHDKDAIHKSRVATRRLKATLDLLKPVLTPPARKGFAKVLKKLRDRLSAERDLDVMIKHLDDIAGQDSFTNAASWAGDALRKKREKARYKNNRKARRSDILRRLDNWSDVRDQLTDCGEAIASLLGESLHLQLESFAERAAQISQGAAGDDIHQLRIAGKNLRYTLEMAEESGHPLPDGIMPVFKQMQDNLGLWHDYVVLTQSILEASTKKSLPQDDMALQEEVMRLAAETLRRGRHQLAEFSKLWNEQGVQIADAIRTAFPLTRPQEPTDTPAPPVPAQQQ